MFRWIDRSPFLNRMIPRLTTLFSKNRGLPVLLGILFFVIGFILEVLNYALQIPILDLAQILFRNIGVLTALVGFLLIEPLGG